MTLRSRTIKPMGPSLLVALVGLPFSLAAQLPGVQYSITNRLSEKVIDDPTQCLSNNGCQLQQWDFNGGLQQFWSFNATGLPGFYSFSNQRSGKVIDVPTQCVSSNACQLQQ